MNNFKTALCALVLAGALSAGVTCAHEINVQNLKLEKSLDAAYAKMQEDGKEPSAEFMELYNGLKDGNYVYDHKLVCAAVKDLDVLTHYGRVAS